VIRILAPFSLPCATGSHGSPKTEFVSHEIFISHVTIDQKFYAELKKVYVMGSEMQPQIMSAQKSEQILIFEIYKELTCFQISKHYFQSFGFINVQRKFNCGYETHFFSRVLPLGMLPNFFHQTRQIMGRAKNAVRLFTYCWVEQS
jgi:hypothetical protein